MQSKNEAAGTETATARADRRSSRSHLVMILTLVLGLQLIAALVLGLGGQEPGAREAQGPLIGFDRELVTGIEIQSPDKDPLLLQKTDTGWRIPALGDFPAAELRLTDLLDKLEALERRLPVATSEAALERFKVADDAHERKLTIEGTDGALATLYLGDSPGFRRIYVRAAGDQEVQEAELALFEASDKPDDWTDKTLLHQAPEDIQALALPGIALERREGVWHLADLADGEELNPDAVADAVRELANLSFLAVLGTEDKPEYKQDAPVLEYTVTPVSGEPIGYRLSKPAEGEHYVLKVSNEAYYFQLAPTTAEGLKGLSRAGILQGDETSEDSEDSEDSNIEPNEGEDP